MRCFDMRKLSFSNIESFDQAAGQVRQVGEMLLAAFRQHIELVIDAVSERINVLMAIFGFTLEVVVERPNLAINLFGGCPEQGFESDRFGPAALNQSGDPKINSMSQSLRESFCSGNVLLRKLVDPAAELFIDLLEPRSELSTAGFAGLRSAVFNCRDACIEKLS